MREFQYVSETKREASATQGVYRSYSGGGYELKYVENNNDNKLQLLCFS